MATSAVIGTLVAKLTADTAQFEGGMARTSDADAMRNSLASNPLGIVIDEREIATHEAGHVASALFDGLCVSRVTMDGFTQIADPASDDERHVRALLHLALAGPASHRQYLGITGVPPGCSDDVELATRLACTLAATSRTQDWRDVLDEAGRRVTLRMAQLKPRVDQLADALLVKRELDASDLLAIWKGEQ